MMLQYPTAVTPGEALAAIALWNNISTQELHQQIARQIPDGVTPEQARIKFVFDYVCQSWEEWHKLELAYMHRVG